MFPNRATERNHTLASKMPVSLQLRYSSITASLQRHYSNITLAWVAHASYPERVGHGAFVLEMGGKSLRRYFIKLPGIAPAGQTGRRSCRFLVVSCANPLPACVAQIIQTQLVKRCKKSNGIFPVDKTVLSGRDAVITEE